MHGLSLVGRVFSDEFAVSSMACSFLALECEETEAISARINEASKPSRLVLPPSQKEVHTHVFCWGLNDKEQLGGPKGSKVSVKLQWSPAGK